MVIWVDIEFIIFILGENYFFPKFYFFKIHFQFEHFAWETACFSEWWPFDDDTCAELRCTACAPAIMSARAVCSKQSKESFSCLQKVR